MLTLLLSLGLALFPQAQNPGFLQGSVTRGGSSEPLAGVEISLGIPGTRERLRATSDGQGRFAFENLPPGRYSIDATREGYFTFPQGRPLPTTITFVTIEPLQTRQLAIELTPGAVIAGRITDPEGSPLSGVSVSVMSLEYDEGRPAFGIGSVPKPTNERGEFRLSWFPPGEYYIRAEYTNPQSKLARKSYYPGTLDSGMAVPVTIRGGESIEGMDFIIPEAVAVRIFGRVVADVGPASGTVRSFYLLPRDGRPMEASPVEFKNTLSSGPPGGPETAEFDLDVGGLGPGVYDLAPFFIDVARQYHSGRTRIEIRDGDIENLAVVTGANVDVPGRIIVAGDAAFQNWNAFQLQLRAREPAVPLMSRSNTARFAADGTFSIPGVFQGMYQIHLTASSRSASPDLYISAIRQGAVDLRDEGTIDVRPSMLPVEITLSPGAGIVRGVVSGPAGDTPKYSHVVLVPQPSRRGNALFYDRTTIDDKGQFSFQGVAPGEYKVFAFEKLPDTAERNAAFLARYDTLGTAVVVTSRFTTEVRLRLLQ